MGAWAEKIFNLSSQGDFRQLALEAFLYQYRHNPVYRKYCDLLGKSSDHVHQIEDIPFLPIEFFKTRQIYAGQRRWEHVFTSSGTTDMSVSRHYIGDLELYRQSFRHTFQWFYGSPRKYCLLALLPGYMENKNSSLIFMVDDLIKQTHHPDSGFYLEDRRGLVDKLDDLEKQGQPTILLGVSFALLELAERYQFNLQHTLVMETGGMKGRRAELTREELHGLLKKRFGLARIHSEYGMAELLSQAYSTGEGRFFTPPWMKIMIRDYDDPFSWVDKGSSGGINVIDLANLYSCPFIETKDIGRQHPDQSFEVLGRFDYSDIRGCNLLVIQ